MEDSNNNTNKPDNGSETEVKTGKSTRRTIPEKEADVIEVAHTVSAAWKKYPNIVLTWTTPEELETAATTLETSYGLKTDIKGGRTAVTGELRAVNSEIDHALRFLKMYLAEIYSIKEAPQFYAQFGMVKTSKGYRLPTDHNRRLHALEQTLRGIEQHELTDARYGKALWQDLYDRFSNLGRKAIASDSATSEQVKIKSVQIAIIRKTLNALVHLITAHYPDSWKEELRVWGFHKEKY